VSWSRRPGKLARRALLEGRELGGHTQDVLDGPMLAQKIGLMHLKHGVAQIRAEHDSNYHAIES